MQKADHSFIAKLGEISGDGIAIYDLNTRQFVYANRYFRQIFELDADSPVKDGKILLKFMPREDQEYLQERFEELLSIGCISPTEFALKVKDSLKHLSGDVLWLEETYAMAVFVKDVTKNKEHDEYVLKFTAQKDILLDMLIHNLSGPLALTKDVLDAMPPGNGEPDKAGKLLEIIRKSTQECINIVNDFLKREFSESMSTFAQNSRFDCVERINEILSVISEMNAKKSIQLHSAATSLFVNSDAVKFLQVIQNLLSNAIKFTGDNGIISVILTEDEKRFSVQVKDNGIGIPREDQSAVFTEKIKGRPGLSGEISNGMGLVITKKLVTMMSGEIWFESTEGKGSSFFVRFPKDIEL